MSSSGTAALSRAGVSIWLDDLSRDLLDSAGLAQLIAERSVVGVTTNPTIFQQAVGDGSAYRAALDACARRGFTAEQTAFELMATDVGAACDALMPVFDATGGDDGRVSIEVSPDVAHDVDGTLQQVREIWQRVDRPNAMIKIPATPAGVDAMALAIAEGISVNATIIFGLSRYRQVINAYLTGLERARANGLDLDRIRSVASVFISRFDTAIDADVPSELRGSFGIANARLAYEIFTQTFDSPRAQMLRAAGAHVQRPLWASTGVKTHELPPTHYVEQLVLSNSVNTMPRTVVEALHRTNLADSVRGLDTPAHLFRDAETTLNELSAAGIDYAEVAQRLESEALQKFEASWSELLSAIAKAMG